MTMASCDINPSVEHPGTATQVIGESGSSNSNSSTRVVAQEQLGCDRMKSKEMKTDDARPWKQEQKIQNEQGNR